MYRKVEKELEKWSQQDKKLALQINGARQVGKTFTIRKFSKEHYKNVIEINFQTMEDAVSIFDNSLDATTILLNISGYFNIPMPKDKTLIFLDEIQECPRARTAIKFLVEDGRYDYISSGSLLGVQYKTVPSYPVGYEQMIRMYPMDFEEFCISQGVQPDTRAYLKNCYETGQPVSTAIHKNLMTLFLRYIVTGGMPDVVKAYTEHKDLGMVINKQQIILNLYRQDINKYSTINKQRIFNVFENIPAQLDDKNRRFQFAEINRNARMREYADSFLWLKDAGVALPCYSVNAPVLPLKINEQSRLFKLFSSDCGLLCAQGMSGIQFDFLKGDISVNMGGILENVFAQQLVSSGFDLHYFNRRSIGEVDFLVQRGSSIIPIEIKSGSDYKRHKALDNVLAVPEWDLKQAIVFCPGNVEKQGKITYLPWYMVMFLKQIDFTVPMHDDISSLVSQINTLVPNNV